MQKRHWPAVAPDDWKTLCGLELADGLVMLADVPPGITCLRCGDYYAFYPEKRPRG
jgi:hypothetical protein